MAWKTTNSNLIALANNLSDEDSAREFLESLRWPDGPFYPIAACLLFRSLCEIARHSRTLVA
jgi:hypothetical protein